MAVSETKESVSESLTRGSVVWLLVRKLSENVVRIILAARFVSRLMLDEQVN